MSLHIGAHISISKGFTNAAESAQLIGADTLQFFTRSPRGGASRQSDPKDIEGFNKTVDEASFAPCLIHAPYVLNLGGEKETTRMNSREILKSELANMQALHVPYYNIHPASRKSLSLEESIGQIAEGVNMAMLPEYVNTTLLFETMSGKGSEVGSTFEEIRELIDRTDLTEHFGVCLDTCHVYCAGYDIRNDPDGVLTEFDRVIGLKRLKCIHLNDTANPYCSHQDRHARIGEGYLGLDAIVRIINHPALRDLPFFLETPNDLEGFEAEIRLLKDKYI